MGIDGVGHFIAQQSQMDLARQDDMLKRGITMPLAPMPLDDAEQPIPIFEWEVVNESRGGLRVRRLDPTAQPIAVGEVAGIKMHGKAYWAVGVVRWVTVFEDGGMEFGLQYLAPMARAVEVKAGAPGHGPAAGRRGSEGLGLPHCAQHLLAPARVRARGRRRRGDGARGRRGRGDPSLRDLHGQDQLKVDPL